jgi:hypothetical protein
VLQRFSVVTRYTPVTLSVMMGVTKMGVMMGVTRVTPIVKRHKAFVNKENEEADYQVLRTLVCSTDGAATRTIRTVLLLQGRFS